MNTDQAIYLLEKYGIRPDTKLGKQMCPEIGTITEEERVYKVTLDEVMYEEHV
jgi:hypothetical protein|tara:strand:+ start:2652 stop:2810 length:159 start_codon:yes stop_codon:yes gene_type:complete